MANSFLKAVRIFMLMLLQIADSFTRVSFIRKPRNYTIIASEDNTVLLRCSFSVAINKKKTWRNGTTLLFAGDERYQANARTTLGQNNNHEYSLRIEKVNVHDEGPYICSIFEEDSVISQTSFLTVNVPAFLTSNLSERETIVDEGESVWLFCNAEGKPKPKISWRHLVPSGDGVMGTGTHLPIPDITREGEGLYECSADNNMGSPATHTMNILVRYPPEMYQRRVSKNVSVSVGQETVLECISSAYPLPTFVWKHGDLLYRDSGSRSSRVQVVNVAQGKYSVKSKLNIERIQEKDFGKYECIAENAKGIANMSLFLKKTSVTTRKPPRQVFRSHRNSKSMGDGNSAFCFHELNYFFGIVTSTVGFLILNSIPFHGF